MSTFQQFQRRSRDYNNSFQEMTPRKFRDDDFGSHTVSPTRSFQRMKTPTSPRKQFNTRSPTSRRPTSPRRQFNTRSSPLRPRRLTYDEDEATFKPMREPMSVRNEFNDMDEFDKLRYKSSNKSLNKRPSSPSRMRRFTREDSESDSD